MRDPGSSFFGALATVWTAHGEFVQLLLALLFAWVVLNWLSTTAARVDGLSMAVRDLRKDLEEIKGVVTGQEPRTRG